MQATLNQKAYQHVRQMLVCGELAAGQRLVTRALAEQIGVSLAPVREALHRLASEGLVQHHPGAGAFVRELSRQDLEELYVLRDATESCAAAEAAKYASDEQLDEMDEIVNRWSEIADEVARREKATKAQLNRWLDAEEQFHLILVEASRNRLLAKIIADHRAIATVFEAQRGNPDILTPDVCQQTCQARRELMQALRKRDADSARILMSQQIQRGKKTVLRFLRRRGLER
jgi:DNA-binding GntR family transcriptional regulator